MENAAGGLTTAAAAAVAGAEEAAEIETRDRLALALESVRPLAAEFKQNATREEGKIRAMRTVAEAAEVSSVKQELLDGIGKLGLGLLGLGL